MLSPIDGNEDALPRGLARRLSPARGQRSYQACKATAMHEAGRAVASFVGKIRWHHVTVGQRLTDVVSKNIADMRHFQYPVARFSFPAPAHDAVCRAVTGVIGAVRECLWREHRGARC